MPVLERNNRTEFHAVDRYGYSACNNPVFNPDTDPTMPIASDPFYIIGHRGAGGEKMENSLAGFKHALTLPIHGIELDIRDHSQALWVIHDLKLERLTGNSGDFDSQSDPGAIRLTNGETIPSLQQVLDLYWGVMPVNIEIKAVSDVALLLNLLAAYPPLPEPAAFPWILISSFNHRALLALRQLDCPWPLAPLSSGIPLAFDQELATLKPWSWHFDDEYLDFEQVHYLATRNVKSLVYTVNDAARARTLRDNGVAGIFTDLPTRMLAET